MKYNLTENSGFSFASIATKNSKTVVGYISVDLHTQHTAKGRAVELLYTDALISGAGKYSRAEFLNAVNLLGATISAGISDGVLTIFIRSSADSFKKVAALIETMLLEPSFDKTELKRIKQTVVNAILESKEDSKAIAHERLRNTLYGTSDRRYTFDDDELIKAIATITPKDLQKLHRHICALPWTCSLASNETQIELARKSISRIKDKFTTKDGDFCIHQQKPPQPSLLLKHIPSKQNIDFSIGAPVPITLHHPDYLPLTFALAVLGIGGFQSRLMSTVREKEGLTYGIFARTETFLNEEQGYWRIITFFSPEKSVQGLTSTFREVKKLYKDGITKEELDTFKVNLHTKQVLLGDSTARLLGDLHAYHLQKFSLKEITEHKKRLLNLTLEEVNVAIRNYLNPKLLTISAAGPISNVKKELQLFLDTVA